MCKKMSDFPLANMCDVQLYLIAYCIHFHKIVLHCSQFVLIVQVTKMGPMMMKNLKVNLVMILIMKRSHSLKDGRREL